MRECGPMEPQTSYRSQTLVDDVKEVLLSSHINFRDDIAEHLATLLVDRVGSEQLSTVLSRLLRVSDRRQL
jgi:hypothetical protein